MKLAKYQSNKEGKVHGVIATTEMVVLLHGLLHKSAPAFYNVTTGTNVIYYITWFCIIL